jgi:hypothetical protein
LFSGPARVEIKGGVAGRAAYVELAVLEFGAGPIVVRLDRLGLTTLTRRAFGALDRAEREARGK